MLEHVGTDGKSLPEQLAAVAAERFPLARQLLLSEGPAAVPQPLPLIVSLIASILESIDRPCCLVFPAHDGIAVATSTLLALTRLQRESAGLLRAHAATSFRERHLVLVNPSNLVYEYQGFFQPNFFRLKVLDKNESRSLSVHEVARLEKTARKRPKGYLNSDLGTPQPTLLGSLAGIPGYVWSQSVSVRLKSPPDPMVPKEIYPTPECPTLLA